MKYFILHSAFLVTLLGSLFAEDQSVVENNTNIVISEKDIEQVKNKSYFDYQASAPCDPAISLALEEFFKIYGNPHANHVNGRLLNKFIKKSRIKIAKSIGAKARNIYFTSGATESNNIAIKSIVKALPKDSHLITTTIEHKSVLEVFKDLEKDGYSVTYLTPDKDGIISPQVLEKAITPKTKFVSIMMVNNEIGTLQDIKALGSICFKHNVIFHTDCAQAFGKIKIDVKALRIDLMSISGHKIYAPKGIGALYMNVKYLKRKGLTKILPIVHGGGQQNGIRPGTMPTELIYAMGLATELAEKNLNIDHEKSKEIQMKIHNILMDYNEKCKAEFLKNGGSLEDFEPIFVLNGPALGSKQRVVYNLNYSIRGVDSADVISELELRGFIIAAGSACNADKSYSHVIEAIDPDMINPPAAVRISFGRFSDIKEAEIFAETLIRAVEYLRQHFPNKGVRACDKTKKDNTPDSVDQATAKKEFSSVVLSRVEKDEKKEKAELKDMI